MIMQSIDSCNDTSGLAGLRPPLQRGNPRAFGEDAGNPDHRSADRPVPQFWGLDDPRWTMKAGTFGYQANYQLLNDNLCDLAHVDFVHETTLSAVSGAAWSRDNRNVSVRDRGLRLELWFVGASEGGSPARSSGLLTTIYAVVDAAFEEDRRIIEAQPKTRDVTPEDQRMTFVSQDKAPEAMRRILRNLIKVETAQS